MAYGIKPPPLAEWIINLGERPSTCSNHCISKDNLVGLNYWKMMVKETNPGCGRKRRRPGAACQRPWVSDDRGHHDGAESFEGDFYRKTLQMSRPHT